MSSNKKVKSLEINKKKKKKNTNNSTIKRSLHIWVSYQLNDKMEYTTARFCRENDMYEIWMRVPLINNH